jgi:alkanesulfonate monooxygenase SsuD/methylene tetrahydromethanopterin reductase-like flavin-dependent oxidoreductase (luciferase family)
VELARAAEAAKFDLILLTDGVGTRGTDVEFLSRTAHSYQAQFEPITLLSALAAVTQRIGLVATASTSFNEPYHVARKFASLDHISAGACWLEPGDIVERARGAQLQPRRALCARRPLRACRRIRRRGQRPVEQLRRRRLRARQGLGPLLRPGQAPRAAPQEQALSVQGPLKVSRPPQGHPVVVEARSSDAGRELAARTAEAVFTAQQTLEDAAAFYADIKGRLVRYGRAPEDLKILPGVFPLAGRSESEAREKFEELQSLIDPVVGLALLSGLTGGFDLSEYPLDGPIPPLPETNASKCRQQLMIDLARRENLTIRQLYQRVAGARGHWQLEARRSRSPISSRNASCTTAPTATTSWRRRCPAGSPTSLRWCCRSCAGAGCSAPSTKAARCANTRG